MHVVLSSVPSFVGGSCFAPQWPTAPGARSRYHRLVWTSLGGTKWSQTGWGELHGYDALWCWGASSAHSKTRTRNKYTENNFYSSSSTFDLFNHRRCDSAPRPGPTRVPQQAGSRSPGGPHSGAGTPGTRPLIRVGAMRAQGRREGTGTEP